MTLTLDHVNRNEIYRYLGYRGQIPDAAVQALVEDMLKELEQVITPKFLYKTFYCNLEQDTIMLSSEPSGEPALVLNSKKLATNLTDCPKVILFAATLGLGPDKLLQKYELLNMAKATVIQSCSAAYIEAYCNVLQENLRVEHLENGYYLRPRFSPGYGDLSIDVQHMIFQTLECAKRLGLTLTDSMLMYPTKSVTAFIGLTHHNDCRQMNAKCSQCENTGCEYRYED